MRRSLAAVLVSGLLLGLSVSPTAAEPDRQAKLNKLTKQAADLAKAYRGEIATLDDTRKDAEKAESKVKKLKRDLTAAQRRAVQFAQTSYMGGGLETVSLFAMSSDPASAATLAYLSTEKVERLGNVKRLIDKQKLAAKEADLKLDQLEKDIKELKSKQKDVEKLLAKFGFQTPGSPDGLTARMVSIRAAIQAQFPMPYGVGCLRPGDFGEHGKGRACDFMMSGGGSSAAGDNKARGDALLQWCLTNGRALGIMYVIWQQKYYDIRTGAPGKMMADRGGATANHYDHVHVSVL
ncbi:coiled-coil domain-containing protein [Herbidospora sp. RD11066]